MPKIQFNVNVANGVAIDVANDVLQVWWIEVYCFRGNQSNLLLHAEIKWFNVQHIGWSFNVKHIITDNPLFTLLPGVKYHFPFNWPSYCIW